MNALGFMKRNTIFIVLVSILSSFVSSHAGLAARDYVELTGVSRAPCVLNGPSEVNLSPINIIDTVDKPVGTRFGSQIFFMQSNCGVPIKIKITAQGVHPITKCVSPMDLNTGIISENYYQLCLFAKPENTSHDTFLEFQNLTATTQSFIPDYERILFTIIPSQGSYTSLTELSNMPAQLVTNLTMSIIVE